MSTKTVKWRTLWRFVLHLQFVVGLVILGFGLIGNNEAQRTSGSGLITSAAVLLLWSWSNQHRERLDKLDRLEANRWNRDTATTGVLSDLIASASRCDPVYVEQRARRKRTDDAFRELREKNS